MKSRYCAQCGAAVESRPVDGRAREVCTACNTIFYENPLPVAACVVLNRRREVLLVQRKREPGRGAWCLPIGFAELGETIGQAARRELREETGLEGRILRLLDADSYASSHYGDLLIVSFELEKVGGAERAGDDAEAVDYFAMDRLPPLAFSSNQKAIRFCAEAHGDEWAIRDSFQSLQEDQGPSLLSDALVSLVQEHADEVTRLWVEDVRSNATTGSYRRLDPQELFARGRSAIVHFVRWLKGHEADAEVRTLFRAVGRERRAQGCPLHEVLSSLTLLRKQVWSYTRQEGVWERPIDVYRVLELNRRIAVFFDKALYHMARGFCEDQESR